MKLTDSTNPLFAETELFGDDAPQQHNSPAASIDISRGDEPMPARCRRGASPLHITFHDPNTPEQLERVLVGVIVRSLMQQIRENPQTFCENASTRQADE